MRTVSSRCLKTRFTVSPSRRALAAVLCIVAGASLAACNTEQIGAAAVVGDARITVAELQEQVSELADSCLTARAPSVIRAPLSTRSWSG